MPAQSKAADSPSTPLAGHRTEVDRSYRGLANQVLELIAAGEFKSGDRLPAERALAERFKVSRTSVREAIIALEVNGTVEVRGGSGIYVCPPNVRLASFEFAQGPGPIEALRARALIESEVAAQAAADRKDGDLDAIFATIADMRDHMQDKAGNEAADREFHLAIAGATGNKVLVQAVAAIWDGSRSSQLWTRMEQHFSSLEMRSASLADHQRIFDGILARDPDQARAAMRGHLERVIREFTQAWR
ncbi:FCD domain-containing protein [Xylophilus rhododendri]|uniref:FCD domain-containing protein n=1 Tax=Xylophilus rhododendri TaxID=2697032 RepID=A0A857J3G9_9BURK|nr:FadR/GntR family transcriptional regulator [Xylophilus rhododendri]QHI97793.1 FCD domain-containing protein [Xylophilus rhododendri]